MLFLLYNSPEFRNIDLKGRKEAAWQAQQACMRDWRFYKALLILIGLVLLCFQIDLHAIGSRDGTVGAGVGFVLGNIYFGRTFYLIGMPHYRRILFRAGTAGTDANPPCRDVP